MTQRKEELHWAEQAGYGSFDSLLTIKAAGYELDFTVKGGSALPVKVEAGVLWSAGSVEVLEKMLRAIRDALKRRDGLAV